MTTNIPQAAWKKSLPMWLTWSRMAACIPLIVVMQSLEEPMNGYIAAIIFILASLTDWLDGYYARLFNAQSTMGKFMDPIADKVLVSTILVLLIPPGRIGPILVIILLARDILIGGIRSIAAADRLIIDAKATGKWKTGVQMISIPAILIQTPLMGIPIAAIGKGLLWLSVVLSLVSGWEYIQLYRKGVLDRPKSTS